MEKLPRLDRVSKHSIVVDGQECLPSKGLAGHDSNTPLMLRSEKTRGRDDLCVIGERKLLISLLLLVVSHIGDSHWSNLLPS